MYSSKFNNLAVKVTVEAIVFYFKVKGQVFQSFELQSPYSLKLRDLIRGKIHFNIIIYRFMSSSGGFPFIEPCPNDHLGNGGKWVL